MKRVNTRTLLATLLLLCCNVAAAYNFEVDGIYYNIIDFSGKAVEVTNNGANNSYKGQVVIPESVEYYGTIYRVTSIGEYALNNCDELTSVVIPDCVTTIGRYAFNACDILSSIIIPNGVTTIEEGTFRGSGIKSIEIPASITTIKENAFESCNNLTSINIPDNVTEIGKEIFYYCNKLAEVTIGSGITTIPAKAFIGCSELRSITIPANITTIEDYAFCACSNLARVTLGSGVTSIGDNAFSNCDRLKLIYNYSELSLSKGWDDYGNVAINAIVIITPDDEEQYHFDGNYLFKSTDGKNTLVLYTGKLISQISLPEKFNGQGYSIGEKAFYNCSEIEKFTIPEDVTGVHNNAFEGTGWYKNQNDGLIYKDNWLLGPKNTKLNGMFVVNEGTTGIADEAFYCGADFIGVIIPSSVKYIGARAFDSCSSLMTATISSGAIGERAFDSCRFLESVTLGEGVTYIGASAFSSCNSLVDITLNEGITHIGSNAFECCGITSITIPSSVRSMGGYVFSSCNNLTNIVLGEGITNITNDIFWDCDNIESITIPSTLKSIAEWAFAYNYKLKEVHISDIAAWCNIDFNDSYTSNPLYNTEGLYLNGEKITDLVIPEGVTHIGDYAFYGYEGLTSVTIPGSVETIGGHAFTSCTGITSLTIGNGVTTIGDGAFYECEGLTNITIPESLTTIGEMAFCRCYNLKTVNNYSDLIFKAGSEDYGYIACYADNVTNNPTGGGSSDGEDGPTEIDGFTFAVINGTKTLTGYTGESTELTLPANYNGDSYEIGDEAFKYNTNITSVTIPSAVTKIGNKAFFCCEELETVTLGEGLEYIGSSAFEQCYELNSVELNEGLKEIGKCAFGYCYDIETINVPQSVECIGNEVWVGCNLREISVDKNNTHYDSRNGCNAIIESATGRLIVGGANTVIPDGVTAIGENAFSGRRWIYQVTIPTSVVTIEEYAFYNCEFDVVTIPENVTSINRYAFFCCDELQEVVIGKNVARIEEGAFAECGNLQHIYVDAATPPTIHESTFESSENDLYSTAVVYVPAGAKAAYQADENWKKFANITDEEYNVDKDNNFTYTILSEEEQTAQITGYRNRSLIKIYDTAVIDGKTYKVTEIADGVFFNDWDITGVIIGKNIKRIGDNAFNNCRYLVNITFGGDVTSIGMSAFQYCDLREVHLPASLTSFGDYALTHNYNLQRVTIDEENPVYDIPQGCNVLMEKESNKVVFGWKGAVIPEDATAIGNGAFNGVGGITSITIPANVRTIGEWAFDACLDLTEIYVMSQEPAAVASNTFTNFAPTLYVPEGSIEAYRSAAYWMNFGNIVEYEPEETGIDSVVAEEESIVYDLQGRRVIEPQKGAIYIKNGKKFIAK